MHGQQHAEKYGKLCKKATMALEEPSISLTSAFRLSRKQGRLLLTMSFSPVARWPTACRQTAARLLPEGHARGLLPVENCKLPLPSLIAVRLPPARCADSAGRPVSA